jgi:hypothetical protein
MPYNNYEQLTAYLETLISQNVPVNHINISVTESVKESACACHAKPVIESVSDNITVKLTSLSDSPVIKHYLTEANQENEIYVKSVEVIPDACGTGKLELFDRTILVNVCESQGIVHVNLDLEVNGKEYNKVPFVVKLTENTPYLKLNTKL